jgi:hypothetical protein
MDGEAKMLLFRSSPDNVIAYIDAFVKQAANCD